MFSAAESGNKARWAAVVPGSKRNLIFLNPASGEVTPRKGWQLRAVSCCALEHCHGNLSSPGTIYAALLMAIMRQETFAVLLGEKPLMPLPTPAALPAAVSPSQMPRRVRRPRGGRGARRARARQRGAPTPSAGLTGLLEGSFSCGHSGGSRKAREHENNCIYICEGFLAGFQRALRQNCLLYSEGFTDCPA